MLWLAGRGSQSCQAADAVDDVPEIASELGQCDAFSKVPDGSNRVSQVRADGAQTNEDAGQNPPHAMLAGHLQCLLQPGHGPRILTALPLLMRQVVQRQDDRSWITNLAGHRPALLEPGDCLCIIPLLRGVHSET